MPVRSLRSSVLRWPDRQAVEQAVRRWAAALAASPAGQDVLQVGYAGSYARGDWGVGSDVDLVVLVAQAAQPFERRAAAWDTTALPVPADLLVYTPEEWSALTRTPFGRRLAQEVVWVYTRPAPEDGMPGAPDRV